MEGLRQFKGASCGGPRLLSKKLRYSMQGQHVARRCQAFDFVLCFKATVQHHLVICIGVIVSFSLQGKPVRNQGSDIGCSPDADDTGNIFFARVMVRLVFPLLGIFGRLRNSLSIRHMGGGLVPSLSMGEVSRAHRDPPRRRMVGECGSRTVCGTLLIRGPELVTQIQDHQISAPNRDEPFTAVILLQLCGRRACFLGKGVHLHAGAPLEIGVGIEPPTRGFSIRQPIINYLNLTFATGGHRARARGEGRVITQESMRDLAAEVKQRGRARLRRSKRPRPDGAPARIWHRGRTRRNLAPADAAGRSCALESGNQRFYFCIQRPLASW